MALRNTLQSILEDAVYAPSGDNSQPWRFALRGETLFIYNLPERDLPFYNFRQSGSHVAHGALIENMLIASGKHGLEPNFEIFPNPKDDNLVATVRFKEVPLKEHGLHGAMRARHTNRKPYENTPLSAEEKESLIASTYGISGTRIQLIEDKNTKKILGKALALNEMIALEDKELHRQFFGHIVWTEKEEREKKMGLYLKAMELPPPARFLFPFIKHEYGAQLMNFFGFSKMAAFGNAQVYTTGAAMGAILVHGDSSHDYLNAGRALERVWLTATLLGLKLQFVTGILFLAARVNAGEGGALSLKHREIIRRAYEDISEIFKAGKDKIPLIFRIGHGPEASAHSSKMIPVIE